MRHSESAFQIAVVRFLRGLGYQVFSVPNGTHLKPSQARIAKAEGMMAGVSDLVIMLPKGQIVFAEMKNPDGTGRQSPMQREFEDIVRSMGYDYYIWDNWKQVEAFINEHKPNISNLKVGGTE